MASTCGAGRGMLQRWPCGRCTRNRGATGVRARAEGARTSVARMRVPSWDSAWLPWPLTDEGWSQTISAAARARHMGWWVGQGRGQPLAAPRAPLLGRDAARQPLPPSRASLAQQRRSLWAARLGARVQHSVERLGRQRLGRGGGSPSDTKVGVTEQKIVTTLLKSCERFNSAEIL